MWYVFNEHRNIADKDNLYYKGETYTFDGVEVYCLLGTGEAGGPLFVDKNHDLSYYFAGSDYMDESESDSAINITNKYGYEWGDMGIITGITDRAVGTGLSNTNSLIAKNLQPETSGWYVVWDKIKEFRQNHSDNWFLPSLEELYLIYEARSNLSNLSTSTQTYYWSSSEGSSAAARAQNFASGNRGFSNKNNHSDRSRLCYTI